MELNINIPQFKCLVNRSWFTKKPETVYDVCYAFAVQSLPGKILTFHVMTDYGMLRSRVPLNEIFLKVPEKILSPDFCQLWDCFGYHGAVTEYDYLYGKRCQVILKDKTVVWCTYLFTIDWHSNMYSETPCEYKSAHILSEDSGHILAQPNNRIIWRDMNHITKPFPIDPKEFKVDTEDIVSVESFSDRWVSEDTDSFYYDINQR